MKCAQHILPFLFLSGTQTRSEEAVMVFGYHVLTVVRIQDWASQDSLPKADLAHSDGRDRLELSRCSGSQIASNHQQYLCTRAL